MLTFSDLRGEQRPAVDLPLFDAPATLRTFDSPEFRGIEFYEVEAKSILNRVPAASRMPFEWTINVYRGCSHSCVYCCSGDTPILMADGRSKPLAEVRVGDDIYGTVWDGRYRRYVTTQVLAHWQTVKPAYRVTLEDGTKIIASGDHRFLTNRGWKHVTGTEHGHNRRSHLTVNNELMGTGQFALPPKDGPEYRRGYLCGMIRGDGLLRSATYSRPGFALVDPEALGRARSYLTELDVSTTGFVFQKAVGARGQLDAIRCSGRQSVGAIGEIVAWPYAVSVQWCKGFLAGIFDAEGSYSRGILRISNTDPVVVDQITSCLRRFGFAFAIETRALNRSKPATYVRLLGGLREHLRFFHSVDPAITRKRTIAGQAVKNNAPLRVVSVEPLGFEIPMYDITTGTGDFIANGVVSHNCFARPATPTSTSTRGRTSSARS